MTFEERCTLLGKYIGTGFFAMLLPFILLGIVLLFCLTPIALLLGLIITVTRNTITGGDPLVP